MDKIGKPKRNLPKVPFGNLIEYGFLKPGDTLFDAKRRFRAHVRVDGSLLAEGKNTGSIHALGASLQGLPSCNGWNFWHIEKDGELMPIDSLRNELRKLVYQESE